MAKYLTKFQKFLFFVLFFLVVAIGSFLAGIHITSNKTGSASIPVIGTVPSFRLTNQLGETVNSDQFRGKIRVVSFLFPYCREYCPLIAINMVNLEQLLKSAHLADKVQIVSYNVDPGQTGPPQMKEFMEQYGWNPSDTHWQYLTGTPDSIQKIVKGAYYVYYKKISESLEDSLTEQEKKAGTYVPLPQVQNKLADKVNPDYDVSHNDALVLVDTKGRIRKIYDDADHVSNRELLSIITSLLPQK